MSQPLDQQARERALDPRRSFIVQAPAGSGKTGLLTQRFLGLLNTVNNPEEVLAITFTRKAAAEMKSRLLEALTLASKEKPTEDYLQTTWLLAQKVLQRDKELGWGLTSHPARLKIQTIDGLCSSLTRQLPILSGLRGSLTVTDSAQEHYRLAAERMVLMVEDAEYTELLLPLVSHLDGNLGRLRELLADMLSKRLNWGSITGENFERNLLDNAWNDWIEKRVSHLQEIMEDHKQVLNPFWIYSCNQLALENPELKSREHPWPEAGLDQLQIWKSLSDLLLTKQKTFRKTVTKKNGFPAVSDGKDKQQKEFFKQNKNGFVEILKSFAEDELATKSMLEALAEIQLLPYPGYSDEHWKVLESLGHALKYAMGQLLIVFQETSELDFSEITLRAQQALGAEDMPTDLALRLDYQMQHILVDEFQDTSQSQRLLLKRLTAGWLPDDGRTLFVVGDPMQSIYRFRAAEVSIFLDAWRQKSLVGIPLETLNLTANFRSQPAIVDWVNNAFRYIFPVKDDPQLGAVRYSASEAMGKTHSGDAIKILPLPVRNDTEEAQWIVDEIIKIRQQDDSESCAVLVKSKSHLEVVAPLLRANKIPFEAVDVEKLELQPIIQDLYSLTAAMLDDADRLHWLSILRAPWCGLSLVDLTRLVEGKTKLIPELLADPVNWQALSDDGKMRLDKFSSVINRWLPHRGQRDLSGWIRTLWMCLQGPATSLTSDNSNALEDASTFFQLLSARSNAGKISLDELSLAVEKLFAKPEQGQLNPVSLMTMHKSKGLEFDHVFLPGLGKKTRSIDQPLLEWLEWPRSEYDVDILLAPIKGAHEEMNPFYKVLQQINKQKAAFENQRLLYVAVTRTKRCLYLSGHLRNAEAGTAEASSLLKLLWPVLHSDFKNLKQPTEAEDVLLQATSLARLDVDLELAKTQTNYKNAEVVVDAEELAPDFEWASERARVVGVVAHKLFQWLPTLNELPVAEDMVLLAPWFASQLQAQGLGEEQTALAQKKLLELSLTILSSDRGRWILDSKHTQGRSEWMLASMESSDFAKTLIVDRSFIDEKNQRWIIDYKTGSHEGGSREDYLRSEKQRYRKQLENYGRAVAKMEDNKIMLGIYFPAMDEWIEWPLDASSTKEL